VVLVVVCLLPPVWGWSFRFGFVQAIQFCVLGFVAPTLLVAGAPWRERGSPDHGVGRMAAWGQRVNSRRVRERAQARALGAAGTVIASTLLWRAAPLVNALVHDHWLLPVEAITLFVPTTFLMVEIIQSPPLGPGISRPYRIGVSAVVMWSAWVVAYLAGMSRDSWYTAFHHSTGHGISANADQQLSAGFVWLLTASVFVPIVFWNLVHWLQSEEDPDEEIVKLFRQEREHGFFGSAD
jgi:cytochrome c oxidase assembly factor CtaG